MHREYGHDYTLPGCEHQLQDISLIAQESIQYLFFQQAKPGLNDENDFCGKLGKTKIKKRALSSLNSSISINNPLNREPGLNDCND